MRKHSYHEMITIKGTPYKELSNYFAAIFSKLQDNYPFKYFKFVNFISESLIDRLV